MNTRLSQSPKPRRHCGMIKTTKRDYRRVSATKRKELLYLIEDRKLTIKAAAERLKINYSTAKNIAKKHKDALHLPLFPDAFTSEKKTNERENLKKTIMKLSSERENQEVDSLGKVVELEGEEGKITGEGVGLFDFSVYAAMIYGRYLLLVYDSYIRRFKR
eukprot:TRINITY_DN18999_c0_g1_i2.p1 TRINITY_DN18999_c0_g1~~TRINITY_DN18999_c0_g1_i2.p1  ORF type:complete len:161 (+),score=18.88 TRINITY_DN18999_c0_g1_i2:276-758(+)